MTEIARGIKYGLKCATAKNTILIINFILYLHFACSYMITFKQVKIVIIDSFFYYILIYYIIYIIYLLYKSGAIFRKR